MRRLGGAPDNGSSIDGLICYLIAQHEVRTGGENDDFTVTSMTWPSLGLYVVIDGEQSGQQHVQVRDTGQADRAVHAVLSKMR